MSLLIADISLLKELRLKWNGGFYKHPAPNGAKQRGLSANQAAKPQSTSRDY